MDEQFWIQGVVKNGQVVLEKPLDLPDGTVVTVMNYEPDGDPRSVGPTQPYSLEEALRIMTEFTGPPDLAEEYLRRQQRGGARE
jgi:hypothetical protein